jgi:hypothetical protein
MAHRRRIHDTAIAAIKMIAKHPICLLRAQAPSSLRTAARRSINRTTIYRTGVAPTERYPLHAMITRNNQAVYADYRT